MQEKGISDRKLFLKIIHFNAIKVRIFFYYMKSLSIQVENNSSKIYMTGKIQNKYLKITQNPN